jgi:RimJ/RimL family protein N-acetyltransferase
MCLKVGRTFGEFTSRDGRKVTMRTPLWKDLDDLVDLINSAVEEKVDIFMDSPVTREQEIEWLGGTLAAIEKGKKVHLVVEVGGQVVGSSALGPRERSMSHSAELGVLVKNGFRGIGIGTMMLQTLIQEARGLDLEILIIKHFSGNDRARRVYDSLGFKETGREPGVVKRDGEYRDLVTMAMKL